MCICTVTVISLYHSILSLFCVNFGCFVVDLWLTERNNGTVILQVSDQNKSYLCILCKKKKFLYQEWPLLFTFFFGGEM